MALSGTLDSFALPDVLRLLASTHKTGRLRVTGDLGSGSVWVDDGDVISTELTSRGSIDPGHAEVIFRLLRFGSGSFTFEAGAGPATAAGPDPLEPILTAAEHMLLEWRAIEEVVASLDVFVELAPDPTGGDVMVDSTRWRCISAVGGGATVAQVGEAMGLGELDVCRTVKELIELGLLVIGEAPPTAAAAHDPADYGAVALDPADYGVVESDLAEPDLAADDLADHDLADHDLADHEAAERDEVTGHTASDIGLVDGMLQDAGLVATDVDAPDVDAAGVDAAGVDAADVDAPDADATDVDPTDPVGHIADDLGLEEFGLDKVGPDKIGPDKVVTTTPGLAGLGDEFDRAAADGRGDGQPNGQVGSDMFGAATSDEASDSELDPAEMARQLANLSPKAAKAVAAAARASTEAERDEALAAVEAEDDTVNRGLLLKFLGSVDS